MTVQTADGRSGTVPTSNWRPMPKAIDAICWFSHSEFEFSVLQGVSLWLLACYIDLRFFKLTNMSSGDKLLSQQRLDLYRENNESADNSLSTLLPRLKFVSLQSTVLSLFFG